MGAISDARDDVANALASTGYRVYPVAPEVPIAPCYVLMPDQPWIMPMRIGSGWTYSVGYQVQVIADARKNDVGMKQSEDMIEDACLAIQQIAQINQAAPPTLIEIGNQGYIYMTALSVTVNAT